MKGEEGSVRLVRRVGHPAPPERQGIGDALRSVFPPSWNHLPQDFLSLLDKLN